MCLEFVSITPCGVSLISIIGATRFGAYGATTTKGEHTLWCDATVTSRGQASETSAQIARLGVVFAADVAVGSLGHWRRPT